MANTGGVDGEQVCQMTKTKVGSNPTPSIESGGSQMCPDCNIPMKRETVHEIPSGGESLSLTRAPKPVSKKVK